MRMHEFLVPGRMHEKLCTHGVLIVNCWPWSTADHV